ncbi:MAG: ABC transporter ATP-binding protein [Anaerolineae bacterium]
MATLVQHPIIDLRHVTKTYQAGSGPVTVLNDVTLTIEPGEFVSVMGPSGSGKSTLLNMITGIDRPTSGDVVVNDQAVHRLSQDRLAIWRGRNLGVIFQFFQLLPTLTVIENVLLPMDFSNTFRPRERKRRALQLLEQVGIAAQARKLPSALSGGEQQRAAIARALATDPPLILADEPTGNLDSHTAEAMFDLFQNLAEQGKTLFIVTHDAGLSAHTQRVIRLRDGCVAADDRHSRDNGHRQVSDERDLAQSLA